MCWPSSAVSVIYFKTMGMDREMAGLEYKRNKAGHESMAIKTEEWIQSLHSSVCLYVDLKFFIIKN